MVLKIHSPRLGRGGLVDTVFEIDSRLTELPEVEPATSSFDEEPGIDDHKIPLKRLLHRYKSNINRGLSTYQVLINRERYGANAFTPLERPSEVLKFIKTIFLGLNSLIWLCVLLCLLSYVIQYVYLDEIISDDIYFGTALIVVTFVSGAAFYYQEYKSSRLIESFSNLVVTPQVTVKRNGKLMEVNIEELVCGDIVEVKYGEIIPADMRIIESSEFHVDNSNITGESEPTRRDSVCTDLDPMETRNLAFSSTNALEGHAKGIVIRVGPKTMIGKLANVVTTKNENQSPIQLEMSRFMTIMTIRSLVFGGTFFVVSLVMGYGWIDSISFVMGIIVANVPEGLALTFTMMLALTGKKMSRQNCLVKNLQSVETLGLTSVICCDKTGTLTQNKMSVAHLWFDDQIAEADTSEFLTGKSFDIYDPGFMAMGRVAALCSRARFKPGQDKVPILRREVDGNASDSAILRYMETHLGNVQDYRKNFNKIYEIPFNSRDNFETFVYDLKNSNDSRRFVAVKGAPESILNLCTKIFVKNNEIVLNDYWRRRIEKVIENLGKRGERIVGFADAHLPRERTYSGSTDPEKPQYLGAGLRFLGLISMIDPPRACVPESISKCRAAGIKVVMVTGDHPITAYAIAKAVGIISPDSKTLVERALRDGPPKRQSSNHKNVDAAAVITGNELRYLSPEEIRSYLQVYKEIVFARTTPEQKYTIVEALQNLGHIVTTAGDGVNDAPALKKADVGIAMGITGTEVSKDTADIVLLDDNFTTIVNGIEEGRLIFDNLKKLVQYNLADNIAEMYSFFVFIMLRIPLPLGTMAMLLSVLGTDVLPAISIVYEVADADIMKIKPRDPRKEKIVSPQLLSYTYGQTAIFEVAAGFFAYFVSMGLNGFLPPRLIGIKRLWSSRAVNDLVDSYGQEWTYYCRKELEAYSQTAFFLAIVLMQVVNVIICKTRRKSILEKKMTNWMMNLAIIAELLIAAAFIYTPFFIRHMGMRSMHWMNWLLPLPFGILMILYDEGRKSALRRLKSGWLRSEMQT